MIYKECTKCAFNRESGCPRVGPAVAMISLAKNRKGGKCSNFSPMFFNKKKTNILMSRKSLRK